MRARQEMFLLFFESVETATSGEVTEPCGRATTQPPFPPGLQVRPGLASSFMTASETMIADAAGRRLREEGSRAVTEASGVEPEEGGSLEADGRRSRLLAL